MHFLNAITGWIVAYNVFITGGLCLDEELQFA